MARKCSICLLGPVGSGKSSLLQSIVDCTEQLAHGYPLDHRIAVHDIEASVYDSGIDNTPGFLGKGDEQFKRLKRQLFSQTLATDAVHPYYFRLDAAGPPGIDFPIFLRIVDSPGEYAIREGDSTAAERLGADVGKLRVELEAADAVVFAIPLAKLDMAGWLSDLQRIIAEMARPGVTKPSRVVFAFTHYERLFIRLGQDAFRCACEPDVALHVVRRAIKGSTWAEGLKKLRQRGTSVHFTVTSAYGFVTRFGNPNIDPHQSDEEAPFGRDGTAAGLTRFWRPFLTAEPFICAALGVPSEYTFSFEQIEGWRPQPQWFPEDEPDEVEPSLLGKLSQRVGEWMQMFNKNRDHG